MKKNMRITRIIVAQSQAKFESIQTFSIMVATLLRWYIAKPMDSETTEKVVSFFQRKSGLN